jgi:hypothetical protein
MKRFTLLFISIALSITSYSQTQTILHVNVNDMVYDSSRNKLFALIGSTDSLYGNNLIQINCDTKQIEKNLFVGSNPELLEITSDHNFLYIALDGSPKIVKVDISVFSIVLQFPIGPIGNAVNIFAEDIETITGNSDLLAVSRKEGGYVEDIVIFDNGVLLPDSVDSWDLEATEIECDSTGKVLFGFNGSDTGFEFGRMEVSTNGVSYKDDFDGVMSGFNLKMQYVDGLLYTNTGSVVNPHLSIPFSEGIFSGIESGSQLALNVSEKESYFATFDLWSEAFRVRRYNVETYSLKDIKEFDLIFPETMSDPELSEFICYANDKFVVSAYESYFSEDNEKYIVFIDSIYSTTTSIANESNQLDEVLIYPNPVSEFLHVDLGQYSTECKIEILNINGQIIYSEIVSDYSKTEIDVSNCISGIYLVKIIADDKVMSERILIE